MVMGCDLLAPVSQACAETPRYRGSFSLMLLRTQSSLPPVTQPRYSASVITFPAACPHIRAHIYSMPTMCKAVTEPSSQ